jgi:hypothetical protein
MATSYPEIAQAGIEHFRDSYQAERRATIAEVLRLCSFFPHFVNQDNQNLMEEISKEELLSVLQSFQKDKSPDFEELPIEFFLGCFDFIEVDLRLVIEESRATEKILPAFNATFVALIPKTDNPSSFEKFRSISLCHCIYKIISEIIAKMMKVILSNSVSKEQFGFLEGRQIDEVVGVAQEGLRTIKIKKLKPLVVKVDLSKAYDRVNWLYLRLLLIHLGFCAPFVTWVMNCVTSVSFSVLINGSATPFFQPEGGLRRSK